LALYDSKVPYRPVPSISPDLWEDFPVFRETFLSVVHHVEDNQAFRRLGRLLYNGILTECRWPLSMADQTGESLRAALGDLRHLQGFLDYTTGKERAPLEGVEAEIKRYERFCRLAARFRKKIAALADELEREVEAAKLG
jgi:hypothetical protein